MPVTLTTLISAAPFEPETRQKLLASLEKFSEAEKFELSQGCWTALSNEYFSKLAYERDKLLLEIRERRRKFNKQDFIDLQKKLDEDYAKKLESAQGEGSIEEVRQQLKKFQAAS